MYHMSDVSDPPRRAEETRRRFGNGFWFGFVSFHSFIARRPDYAFCVVVRVRVRACPCVRRNTKEDGRRRTTT